MKSYVYYCSSPCVNVTCFIISATALLAFEEKILFDAHIAYIRHTCFAVTGTVTGRAVTYRTRQRDDVAGASLYQPLYLGSEGTHAWTVYKSKFPGTLRTANVVQNFV